MPHSRKKNILQFNYGEKKPCKSSRGKKIACTKKLPNPTPPPLKNLMVHPALSQLISISLFLEGEGGWELAEQ